jgi:hypothetical protein
VAAALATAPPAHAINLNVSAADVERALVIARERDRERAPFHASYNTAINGGVSVIARVRFRPQDNFVTITGFRSCSRRSRRGEGVHRGSQGSAVRVLL